jgi:hypothetical protein
MLPLPCSRELPSQEFSWLQLRKYTLLHGDDTCWRFGVGTHSGLPIPTGKLAGVPALARVQCAGKAMVVVAGG